MDTPESQIERLTAQCADTHQVLRKTLATNQYLGDELQKAQLVMIAARNIIVEAQGQLPKGSEALEKKMAEVQHDLEDRLPPFLLATLAQSAPQSMSEALRRIVETAPNP